MIQSCAWAGAPYARLGSRQGARLGQRGQQLRRAREHRPVERLGRRRRVARVDRAAAEHRRQRARLRGVAERRACRAAHALSPRAASAAPAALPGMPRARPRPFSHPGGQARLLPHTLVASRRCRFSKGARRPGAAIGATGAREDANEQTPSAKSAARPAARPRTGRMCIYIGNVRWPQRAVRERAPHRERGAAAVLRRLRDVMRVARHAVSAHLRAAGAPLAGGVARAHGPRRSCLSGAVTALTHGHGHAALARPRTALGGRAARCVPCDTPWPHGNGPTADAFRIHGRAPRGPAPTSGSPSAAARVPARATRAHASA